jgi:hypothetical protein
MESTVVDKRKAQRYSSVAGISVNGFEGQALLKDISNSGFCLESATCVMMNVNEQYIVKITPEPSLNIKPFEVSVGVQWVKNAEDSFETGLKIIKPPLGQAFKQYLEALRLHRS